MVNQCHGKCIFRHVGSPNIRRVNFAPLFFPEISYYDTNICLSEFNLKPILTPSRNPQSLIHTHNSQFPNPTRVAPPELRHQTPSTHRQPIKVRASTHLLHSSPPHPPAAPISLLSLSHRRYDLSALTFSPPLLLQVRILSLVSV